MSTASRLDRQRAVRLIGDSGFGVPGEADCSPGGRLLLGELLVEIGAAAVTDAALASFAAAGEARRISLAGSTAPDPAAEVSQLDQVRLLLAIVEIGGGLAALTDDAIARLAEAHIAARIGLQLVAMPPARLSELARQHLQHNVHQHVRRALTRAGINGLVTKGKERCLH